MPPLILTSTLDPAISEPVEASDSHSERAEQWAGGEGEEAEGAPGPAGGGPEEVCRPGRKAERPKCQRENQRRGKSAEYRRA